MLLLPAAAAAQFSISGTVTGPAAVTGQVSLFTNTGTLNMSVAITAGTGVYTFPNRPAGIYYVRTANTAGLIDEVWNNLSCGTGCTTTNGTPVVVTNSNVTGIDFALEAGVSISGTVTNSQTQLAVTGVGINIYNASGNSVGAVFTNAAGSYQMRGLAPNATFYAVTSNSAGLINELHNDVPCIEVTCNQSGGAVLNGDAIAVGASGATGIDFILAPGTQISGTVIGDRGDPLSGIFIQVFNAEGVQVGSANTQASGAYTTGAGLPNGTYFVQTSAFASAWVNEIYDNISCTGSCTGAATIGTAVMVSSSPAPVAGIGFELDLGGAIRTRIRDANTGVELAGVTVQVYNGSGTFVTSATTDGAGEATARGLPAGDYYFRTINSLGYIDERNDGTTCLNCNPWEGNLPIKVKLGLTTASGAAFLLSPGGRISGVVTKTGGVPVPGVTVQIHGPTGQLMTTGTTSGTGAYISNAGLPPGTYFATTSNSLGYINERFDDVACGTFCGPGTGTPIVIDATETESNRDFELSVGGRVSGTVYGSTSGGPVPLKSVSVQILAVGSTAVSTSGFTTASGQYITSAGLQPGQYFARTFNNLGYLDAQSAEFTVTSGATTAGIDLTIAPGGRIRGRVTSGGNPVAGVNVNIVDATGFSVSNGISAADGTYTSLRGLPSGTYYAATTSNLNYINERYQDTPCLGCRPNEGTPISVTLGNITTGIDFDLSPGGRIEGMVTEIGTITPVAYATVLAYNAAGLSVRSGRTDEAGRYVISGLLGGASYFVRTVNQSGYIDKVFIGLECPPGTFCPVTTGVAVPVIAGSTTRFIDIGLARGGQISGQVTDTNGAPIVNANVTVYDASGRFAVSGRSDGAGSYTTLIGLRPGTYYAVAGAPGYIRERYNETECFPNCVFTLGTGIPVAAGSMTSGIDFTLAAGGRISGRVRDAITLTGLANVQVGVFTADGVTQITGAGTDGSGRYTSTDGLKPGSYLLRTTNFAGRIDEVYDNLVCLPATEFCSGGATPVTVTGTQTTANRDFDLASGARISGMVSDASTGLPLANVAILLFDEDGRQVGGKAPIPTAIRVNAVSDSEGRYTIGAGVPDGTYFLATRNLLDYVDERNDGGVCVQSRCDVTLGNAGIVIAGGASQANVNFSLARGGRIAGVVTAAGGTPLPGVNIDIFASTGAFVAQVISDAAGGYTMQGGLLPGTYYVRTSNGLGYVDELFNNLICVGCPVTGGTPVSVATGDITAGIDFALAQGGLMTGTIYNATSGAPIPNAPVSVLQVQGGELRVVARAVTDENGAYAVSLPAGTYYVQADGQSGYSTTIHGGPAGDRPRFRRGLDGIEDAICPRGLCNPEDAFAIRVDDGDVHNQVNVGVVTCGALNLIPLSLASGRSINEAYSQALKLLKNGAELTDVGFYITSGQLPPGLTLNPTTGILSGTSTAAGSTSFDVTGVDANGCGATRTYNPTFCGYAMAAGATVPPTGGSASFEVNLAAAGCTAGPWVAQSSASWVTVTGGATGAGTVSYTWQARGNFSLSRTATITAGGNTFTITQTGLAPAVSASPLAGGIVGPGSYSTESIAVTTNTPDAPWIAAADQPWISVSPLSGNGPGTVTVAVQRNATQALRSGAVTITGNTVPITQRANGVPGPPTSVGATVANFNVNLAWLPPQTDGDATSYDLIAGTGPGLSNIGTISRPTNSYSVAPVPSGQYYVRVKSKNEFGTSVDSEEYVLTVAADGNAPPGPPLNLVVTLTGNQITMTWDAPATGSPATSYFVEAGSATGLANLAVVPVNGTSFSYAPVPNGFYYLRVRGRNASGVGPPSTDYLLNVGNVPMPPGVPQSFAHSVAGSTVSFTWAAPATGGVPTAYILEAGSAPGLANLAVANVGNVLAVSFSGVPSGIYHVRLRAANALGQSPPTANRVIVVP
jgi:hypothetical protein